MTDIILKALLVSNFPLFSHSRILSERRRNMQATSSLVYYFLLVSLCIDFSQNETNALLGRQRRRTHHGGLRRSSSAGHRSPRQPRMKLPAPVSVVPSIPLINIDDGVMGVFDSLIGLGGHESSYSVLPGKNEVPLLFRAG